MTSAKGSKSKAEGPRTTGSSPKEIVELLTITQGTFKACIVGLTPLLHNRPSEKTKRTLLLPGGRKTTLERALSLKHSPLDEFRASPHLLNDPAAPTYVALKGAAFKRAMQSAALDIPGANKAQIGRLVRVPAELVGIYGIPAIHMDIVKSADMNRTPDVRTRACMREWACYLTVTFIRPLIRPQAVANLLAGAGLLAGVGDGRPEKGALVYGQFRVCDQHDPDFLRIIKTGARSPQLAAMESPVPFNEETDELLTWFDAEVALRQKKGVIDEAHTGTDRAN